MMRCERRDALRRAQSISEYAVVMSMTAALIATMSLYARRSIQAGIKQGADRFSIIDGAVLPGDSTQRVGLLQELRQDGREGSILQQQSRSEVTVVNQIRKERGEDGSVVTTIGFGGVPQQSTVRGTLAPGGVSARARMMVDKSQ